MAVQYRKSSLTSLFEQLPTLILGYMAQKQKQEADDRRFERKFAQEKELLDIRLEHSENTTKMDQLLHRRDAISEKVEDSIHDLTLKFPGIKPENYTKGADELIDAAIMIEGNEVKSLSDEIKGYKQKNKALRVLESSMIENMADFSAGYGPYAGESGVLNPTEFKAYKESLGQDSQFITSYPHTIKPNYQDSLSVANKNPLNVTDFYTGEFLQFNTHQEGWQAGFRQVDREYERNDTVEQLIKGGNPNAITADRPVDGGWSGDSEDIQNSYVDYIAKYTGSTKDTPIQNIDKDLLVEAMAKFEGYLDKDQFAPSQFDLDQQYGMNPQELEQSQLAFDVGYRALGDPSQLWALERQTIDYLKAPLETSNASSYSVIQGTFQLDEERGIDDMEDLAEALRYPDPITGEEKIPSIEAMNTLSNMLGQPEFDSFLNNLYLYENLPGATQGQIDSAAEVRELLENAPGINLNFRNMESRYGDILSLKAEKAGDPLVKTVGEKVDLFKGDLDAIDTSDVKRVLDTYMNTVSKVEPDLHEAHWNVLEEMYKDTDIDIHSEFKNYMKGKSVSGDQGAPVTFKPSKVEKPTKKSKVFKDETYDRAKENLLEAVDEYNKYQYIYGGETTKQTRMGSKYKEQKYFFPTEAGDMWEQWQFEDDPKDSEYRADFRARWEEYKSLAKKYFELIDLERGPNKSNPAYDPDIPWYSKGAGWTREAAAAGQENLINVVNAKYPDLVNQMRALSLNPVTGMADFVAGYNFKEGEWSVGNQGGMHGKNRRGDEAWWVDDPSFMLPGWTQRHALYFTDRAKGSNVRFMGDDDQDAALNEISYPLVNEGTDSERYKYQQPIMDYNYPVETFEGHLDGSRRPAEHKVGLGRLVKRALDALHLLEDEDGKTTLFGHEDILLTSRHMSHIGPNEGEQFTGAPFIPMGDYFEEVTEDWPEWKKQAYVDQLEEYLFEMGKLNPDYVSSSVMHPSQLYKGSLYDVKPELDILDVFDK